MSNSLRPYAGQRASAQLGSVPLKELKEFIEDAVPEAKVDSLHELDRMSIIFRVLIGTKYFTFRVATSTQLYQFEAQVDLMLERIQEELDREPEEPSGSGGTPEDAQEHYVPKAWAPKVATKAIYKNKRLT